MNTEIGEFDIIFRDPLEKDLFKVLFNAEKVFRNIYKKYFSLEFLSGSIEEYGLRMF